jgi:hypothetical protein
MSVRMHSQDVKAKYMAHVETHLTAQKDSVLRACPASMESGDGTQATWRDNSNDQNAAKRASCGRS